MLRLLSILLLICAILLLILFGHSTVVVWIAFVIALTFGAVFGFSLNSADDNAKLKKHSTDTSDARNGSNHSSQSERILKAAMSGMREGVVVVDDSMRVIASNDASRSIFPRCETSLDSRRLSELTRNRDIYSAFENVIGNGQPSETKVEMLDIETRVFDLRVVPLRLRDDNNSRGAIGVFFDITRIERLERVRQEFLSNVSHELRTPLTAILAFVETLEDGALEDPENNRRFLGIIRKNAERMRNLIDDILDLSAIEGGNVFVESAPVRLREMVQEISTALSSRATDRGVTIINEVDNSTVVFADPRRLEQMLTNLIDNGLKFNKQGGTVTVRHNLLDKDRILITDTGDGIDHEHAVRIFERFYRIDRARSRDMGGTGLGLAIVKHLARLHGGEVSVQSTIGEGSTFIIDLPRAADADEPISGPIDVPASDASISAI
ncbi:MAG: two-component system, OmpR family, phosphate regulon sensor histidine kinase PhoR [Blastocatellia bacterium]|nr:two-component system, OmpR family, phosphate regulon sensor histidine kinase PhoR [Blastocatellia bacterium]